MKSAGLILAAGESRRMGTPKALLPYRGSTFLETIVRAFSPSCSPVIIVLGAQAEAIRASVGDLGIFVTNQDHLRGQITSMQCGLRAVPPGCDGVIFTLVDHPAVSASLIEALLPSGADSALLRVPRYKGRHGHPIWFSNRLIQEFLNLPETASARDVVHRHRAQTSYIDTDEPGILVDIDDPASYRALIGEEK